MPGLASGRAEDALVVADLDGDVTKARGVLATVVRTEQQVGATRQYGADRGARTAPVTALGGGDLRNCRGRRHHVLSNTRHRPALPTCPRCVSSHMWSGK